MKRFLFAIAIVCGTSAAFAASPDDRYEAARDALSKGSATAAIEEGNTFKAPDGFMLPFGPCDESDSLCLSAKASLVIDVRYAYQGAYQAQRNIAYCMSTGCDGALIPNQLTGCAWRLVIVASGSPLVDASDTTNLKHECGKLDNVDLKAATAKAHALFRLIYKRPLP